MRRERILRLIHQNDRAAWLAVYRAHRAAFGWDASMMLVAAREADRAVWG